MRALVVTLQHRQYGLAEVSFMKAFRYWKDCQPDAHFAHIRLWGNERVTLEQAERHRFDLGHEIVTAKYNEARNIFLAGNWDTLITLEDDMVIPEDGFIRLQNALNDGADVVYSLYSWRHDLWFMPQSKLSAYVMLTQNDGRSIGVYRERLDAARDKVIDVAGVGFGFTAIKRHVMENIAFRRGGEACNDWYFALDARAAGYVQRCDMGLQCGHITLEPSPMVIYPDLDSPTTRRLEHI